MRASESVARIERSEIREAEGRPRMSLAPSATQPAQIPAHALGWRSARPAEAGDQGRKRHGPSANAICSRRPRAGSRHDDDADRFRRMGAERALSRPGGPGARSELRQIPARCSRASSGSPPACAGAKGRSGSATRAACCGATSPTTASCAGTRRPARVSVYRKPSNNANGNTRDRQGRLVTCEHDARRVTRTEYDGSITVLIDKFDGKPLNSPNDIVVKSDDSIWFTDPPFGILGNYEGHVDDARTADQRLPARSQDRAATWS